MEQPPSPLRFRGNRSNPNYPAVRHLLRTYAAHLGAGLQEMENGDADIHWDLPVNEAPESRLMLPGRALAVAETHCARTREGFPVPIAAAPRAPMNGEAGTWTAIDACGGLRLEKCGGTVRADWDLLSFCADILFKRADFLPQYRDASREGLYGSLCDKEFGLAQEPWVDRWMFRLLAQLPRLRTAVENRPAQARLWLTHDLDSLSKWRLRSAAGQLARTPWHLATGRFALLRRNYRELLTRAFTGRDPYDNLEQVQALEGLRKSASFLLANGRDHIFHRYELSQPRYRRVLGQCLRAGNAVGLHGQVQRIGDAAGIRAEVDKLAGLAGVPVRLNRQHYLRWDAAKTFAGLEAAGIRVDSTLGYNDTPGFRTGTAWPYLWFDCAADRPTALLEAPLLLAEFQFYDPSRFDAEAVRQIMFGFLEKARLQGGVLTILFHNQYFHAAEFPGQGRLYADLIAWADARGLPDFDPLGTHARYLEADVRG